MSLCRQHQDFNRAAGSDRDELIAAKSTPQDQLLLYYGTDCISVRGPVTDRLYEFSRHQPFQIVDPRDSVPMLKTRLFRRMR